ncbi:MAG: hypothetical protein ACF8SC_00830 [Phycisphaerales bacterium JB037]
MRLVRHGKKVRIALVGLACGGFAAGMVGCKGPAKGRTVVKQPPRVNTGLDALASRGEARVEASPRQIDPDAVDQDALARASLDLQALLDARNAEPGDEPGADVAETPIETAAAAGETATDRPGAVDGEEGSVEPTEVADAERRSRTSLDDRIAHSARELAALLVARSSDSDDPAADLTRAAIADAVGGGDLWTSESAMRSELGQRGLVAHEPGLVIESRRLASELIASMSVTDALDALDAAAVRLRAQTPAFRVRDTALCKRVRGLASYEEFPSATFLVGQSNRVIVYTELERFGHRELLASGNEAASTGDRYAADVSQELTLYHEPGGDLQVWHQPRARVIETSRRPRSEMYLINEVILPARLTVGSYTLKVVTRDETTGMTDERSIPIRLVADASLTRAGEGD